MEKNIAEIEKIPYETVQIKSYDGLTLYAKYYHLKDGAPIDICMHGYRGTAERDMNGGFNLSREYGRNLLLCDQRAHGKSQGHTLTFGIKERFDVLSWANYLTERFGKDCRILLVGLSMGATTVLMASGENLPKNVRGVIADCPYSSPIDIITVVGGKKGIPPFIMKPLAIIAARLFGGFSVLGCSAVSAVRKSNLPILIIHGDADTLVPFYMSEKISQGLQNVRLERFCGAEHATSYLSDSERYFSILKSFKNTVLKG
jgi:fermentation-respiration switch protein FrsA (DUF1100 family)